jgi:hypothetical protein
VFWKLAGDSLQDVHGRDDTLEMPVLVVDQHHVRRCNPQTVDDFQRILAVAHHGGLAQEGSQIERSAH